MKIEGRKYKKQHKHMAPSIAVRVKVVNRIRYFDTAQGYDVGHADQVTLVLDRLVQHATSNSRGVTSAGVRVRVRVSIWS